jgi:ankyrin repeat protein
MIPKKHLMPLKELLMKHFLSFKTFLDFFTGLNSRNFTTITNKTSRFLFVSSILLVTFFFSITLSAYQGNIKKDDTLLCYEIRSHSKYRNNKKNIITLINQSRKSKLNKSVKYLYRGNWIKETPLIIASTKGMNDIVKLLLKKGVNINTRRQVNNRIGYSPLMCAAGSGHLETVRVLLNHWKKPYIHYKDSNGRLTGVIQYSP